MSRVEKLIEKLRNESIAADELATLLRLLGWTLQRTRGSHQAWLGPEGQRLTLSPHGKDLKRYQIKLAKALALGE